MGRPLAPADYAGCPVTVTEAVAAGRTLTPPRWGLWDALWALLIASVLGLGAGVLLTITDAPLWAVVIIGTAVPWIGFAGWPLLVTAWRGNGPRIDLGLRLTWSDVGWGALAGVLATVAAAVAALITQRFFPDVTSTAAEAGDKLVTEAGRPAIVVFALMVMVAGPIVEELYFRGLLFAALRKRGVPVVWTVIGTALLFAAFHFEPVRLLILLPSGLVLGWVRAKTGSLGSSMIAHGLINAPGAILLLVGAPGMSP